MNRAFPLCAPLLVASLSACSFIGVRGPPEGATPSPDLDCTQSMAMPVLDTAMVGLYTGVATLSLMETVEIDLATLISVAVLAGVQGASAASGRTKVAACRALRSGGYKTTVTTPEPAAVVVPGAKGHHVFLAHPTEFDLDRVVAIELHTTQSEVIKAFGEPSTKAAVDPAVMGGCSKIWTWQRGSEAMSVSFREDDTVCSVAIAGGRP